MQELLPLMDITEREILAKEIYDELVMGILRVLSRLDLTVTGDSDQQQVECLALFLCARFVANSHTELV